LNSFESCSGYKKDTNYDCENPYATLTANCGSGTNVWFKLLPSETSDPKCYAKILYCAD